MRIGILGPLTASAEGRDLKLGPGRQRALLILLVLRANEVVSVDRLVDELWASGAPQSALKVVQGYVSHLRRVLPPDTIVTHESGYRLQGVETDAGEFERLVAEARLQAPGDAARTLRTAIELWRGRPLDEVEYEPWAQPEVARLEELRLVAVEERIAAELQLGGAVTIVPELEALVAEYPLRERLRAQLMLALYRSGRQADALARYSDARQRLVDELGIEPGPELRQLQQRILIQDPDLGQEPNVLARVTRGRPWAVAAGVAVLAGAGAAVVVLAVDRGTPAPAPAVPRNSVAVVDPTAGRPVDRLSVSGVPGTLALEGEHLWVVDGVDRTIAEYDARSLKKLRTVGVDTAPYRMASGPGELWLGNAFDGTVSRLDVATGLLSSPFRPEPTSTGRLALLVASGSLWIGAQDNTVSRLDPRTNAVQAIVRGIEAPVGLAATDGAIWAIEASRREVVELSTRTNRIVRRVHIGGRPIAVATAAGAPWVLTTVPPRLWRVDGTGTHAIPVGANPSDLATGLGRLWVVSDERGTLAEVDPLKRVVVGTRAIAQPLGGLVAGAGRVWVIVP